MKKYGLFKTICLQLKLIGENGYKRLYLIYFIKALFTGIEVVVGTLFTKVIIDNILGEQDIKKLIYTVSGLILFSIIATTINKLAYGYTNGIFQYMRQCEFERCVRLIHNTKYENIEDSKYQDEQDIAFKALQSDGMGFQNFYSTFSLLLDNMVAIILFGIIISRFNYLIFVAAIISSLLSALSSKLYANYNEKRQNDLAHTSRQKAYFNTTNSDFSYGKDIRIFSLKETLMKKYKEKSKNYIQVVKDIANKKFLTALIGLVSLLIQDMVAYLIIIYGYYNQQISIAEVSLYITVVVTLSTILRTTNELVFTGIKDLKLTQIYFNNVFSEEKENKNMEKLEIKEGKIEFINVSFKYPNTDRLVLKNLNLTIDKGEKLAIVGVNGAGKTTIVKLMCGLFEPTEGKILIDGVDIHDVDKTQLQRQFSTAFQDFNIYATSIMSNVIGPDKTPECIERGKKCLESVGLKEVIEKLPKSYDTQMLKVLDEHGVDLSGGQRQKIAIARALYKDGKIVILDEPTAALDALAESEIYESFASLVENKTAIYISHRLSSTKFCDKIAFFDETGLAEYGNHEELMMLEGKYFEMFKIQGKYYQKEVVANE